MYLLSEMHIRVYNARHIKREAAVIFFGRWRDVLHAQADGKRVTGVRHSRNSRYNKHFEFLFLIKSWTSFLFLNAVLRLLKFWKNFQIAIYAYLYYDLELWNKAKNVAQCDIPELQVMDINTAGTQTFRAVVCFQRWRVIDNNNVYV
jgi:hypothetical protein